MSESYYIRIRGRVHGPMAMPRLQALAQKGQLSRIHDISHDGQNWQKASLFPEVFERRAAVATTATAARVGAMKDNRAATGAAAEVATQPAVTNNPATSPPGDAAQWHYSINSMQYGPVSKMELAQLVKNGSLAKDDLVWKEGMSNWGEAGNMSELTGMFQGVKSRRAGRNSPDGNLTDPMRRLMARVIDRLILLLVIGISIGLMILISIALGVGGAAASNPDGTVDEGASVVLGAMTLGAIFGWIAAIVVPISIMTAVQVYYLSKYSQTIGKRILKMQIVRIEDGQPAGFGNGFILRTLCNNVIGGLLFFTAGAYFVIDACFIFRDDRRCIHDLIAKTKVVDVD
jgi:uncharacterized RDD family membrane protein YckC